MAKILNTREHEITINIKKGEEVVSMVVPAGRPAEGANKIIPGELEVDDAALKVAKTRPVVAAYFDEGWLSVAKAAQDSEAKE